MSEQVFIGDCELPKNVLHLINGSPQSKHFDTDLAVYEPEAGALRIAEHASITLVIEQKDSQQQYAIFVGAHAKLTLIFTGLGSLESNFSIHQALLSEVNVFQIMLSVESLKHKLLVALNAPGSAFRIDGLQLALQKQRLVTDLIIEHNAAETKSYVLYKNVANQQGEIALSARVKVEKGAQEVYSDMTLNNLLLSNHAYIDTKPELEIYADAVKCSHGTTVGDIDEKALFYLKSRGISALQARILLIKAFMQQVIDRLGPEYQAFFMDLIERNLQVVEAVNGL